MIVIRATTAAFLGLIVAVSLFICSSALPTSAPSLGYGTNVDFKQQQLQENQAETTQSHDYYPIQDQITRQTSSFPRSSPLSINEHYPFISSIQAAETNALTSPTHQSKSRGSHRSELEAGPLLANTRTTREQILHHCTTHFLELLDSDVSDRLVLKLSRLVMMLPVIGVETRAVMRAKVVQVMQQVSSRLTNYEAIRRVIRSAVDDAGLLLIDNGHTIVTSRRRGKKRSRDSLMGARRIQYKDSDYSDDDASKGSSYYFDYETDMEDEGEDGDSGWFRLPGTLKSSSRPGNQKNNDGLNSVDESQIPVVAEAAMEAVLDYMSEVLTPVLVIHQLTEGIQNALYHISKVKSLERPRNEDNSDEGSDMDFDINALSSQSISKGDHHGLNHLNDDWIWSPSSTDIDGVKAADNDYDVDEDSTGQDKGLWDKDMEVHGWDTGHLFEDFVTGEKDDEMVLKSSNNVEAENDNWSSTQSDDDDEIEGYLQNPFAIGIQEDDDLQQEELDDESIENDEDYERDGVMLPGYPRQNRFQKRSLSQVNSPVREELLASITSPSLISSKRGDLAFLSRHGPDFAPDPRLETLLAQLVGPVLRTFIEKDFPASCKRVQGELMDGIIWSIDQTESSTTNGNEDQLVLLSELEY
ncbi:hypothetical protein BGX27_010390 [Mortierella sp. AM989]|nr:hypothetical protein BGX27_010390 [Mortierella sp. AM989]